MAEVTDVTIAAGVPTAGDGTVPTLSKTNTLLGAVGETVPATDIAASGVNGRLQRIAQRITSFIALLPSALGAGGGLKVDGSGTALPVSGTVGLGAGSQVIGHVIVDSGGGSTTVAAATLTSVNSSAASQTLLVANANRKGVIINNTDANDLYLKYGAAATTSGGGYSVIIPTGAYWEMPSPIFTGILAGLWSADGAGYANITEL